ncbi:hypothetical protein EW026_g7691 [Hermanssonia centrifuga]|uniref:Uncharacterized protein n=1 Tax=Hermanssonia centrifuga TaxID=98765 RepID=A0A4V3X9C0_9APHY|nr:hypothetical protein EW026_g7691 [Hermanssonia centrifuga]
MAAAFTRGMAFICRNGQPQIDLLIPILLSNTTIGEKHMSAFLIQVKRRKGSGIYPISAETLGFFKYPNATKHDKRPYISLIMDLGVRVTLPNYAQLPAVDVISKAQKMARLRQVGASSIETQIPPRKTESKERGKGKTPDHTIPGVTKTASTEVEVNTHPLPSTRNPTKDQPRRYSIHAFGCSDTVYKVIRPEDRQKWQTLLVDEFLADHPRKETLAQVRRLKPFFTLGKECYHWFNDPSLNLDPPPAVPHEADQTAVFIGEYLDEGEEDANADAEISSPMVVNQSSEQDDAFNEQPQLDQDAEENIEMVE